MNQQTRTDDASDGSALGASFEAHTSHNLGSSFAAHTSSPPDPTRLRASARVSRTWVWIGISLVILLGVLALRYFRKRPAPAAGGGSAASGSGRGQQGPAAITTDQSRTGNINIYVDALGTVTPTNTVTLYSQITGRVMDVHYREGQVVRKGDPLIDIDPRPYQATLTQAQGTLQHDEAVLAEARIDLARYQAAFAKNAIARQQLEDQEQVVKQYEGSVKADEGNVAYDQVQLSYCHIVAPISGRVGLRLVDPGNTIFSGSSSTLVVVTQLQPITVVFNVSEDNLPQIQAQLRGRKVLEVDAYDRSNEKQIDKGKLASLNNQIDTTTGTVKFRADFANRDLQLFPNQFVNARLLVTTLHNATLIPSAAVQHNGTASFVYVVKPAANNANTVAVQPITVLTNDDKATAVQGLGAGATLAVSGFDRLENGVPVLVRNGQHKGPGGEASQGRNTAR